MHSRDEIIAFCDDLLEIGRFGDYGPNGIQVPGRVEVRRIATAVSANLASIEAAIKGSADLLIAHHGLFWDFHQRALSEAMAARLRLVLGSGLSVAGYHLPLDAHREIGNNALLARQLGFELSPERFGEVKGNRIGTIGRRLEPIAAADLFSRIASELDREPLVFAEGPEMVSTIGVVTGAGASEIHDAIALGLDAFLTGEPAEHVMADAREGGIHFIAAGHYATEVCGIRALGDLVAERFGVEHEFLDLPNPV
ncbi:MAG: Nif3-like dinuclear metal center hexameric protein [Solirubrobacterales bacterium]|nr:Nif3-like dinuclear metal center hexameric protein [Solirubrobacterales bacterium]